jgi:hypothetical protein
MSNNDNHSSPLVVWHPSVHSFYQEQLYIFLIKAESFDPYFKMRIRTIVENECRIRGRCFYEVFSNYDILLRAWVTPQKCDKLIHALSNELSVVTVASFAVLHIYYIWDEIKPPMHDVESKTIAAYTSESLAAIQDGNMDESILTKAKKDHLILKYVPIQKRKKGIKFYCALQSKAPVSLADLSRELSNYLQNNKSKGIQEKTLYTGAGIAQYFVKAVASNYFEISSFVLDLCSAFKLARLCSQTMLVATDSLDESDTIDFRGALQTGTMSRIASFLDVNEDDIEKLDKMSIRRLEEQFVRTETTGVFAIDHDGIIKRMFVAFVQRNEGVMQTELTFLLKIEGMLQRWFPQIMNVQFGKEWYNKSLPTILQNVEVTSPREKLSFQDIVCILGYVDARNRAISQVLIADWEQVLREAVVWRNAVAHSKKKLERPIDVWEEVVDFLCKLLPVYYKLKEVAK